MPAIRFPEGTTYRQQYTLRDNRGAVIQLGAAQLSFAVYGQADPKTGVVAPLLLKTVGSGITVTDSNNGVIVVHFLPEDTVDLAGTYDWELQLLESNGDKWLAGYGPLVIRPARRLDTA